MSETRIPEALALLREKGWCKGAFIEANGERCINGALLAVWGVTCSESVNDHGFSPDHSAIRRVITNQYDGQSNVAAWNDDPATTFEDVEFVLEKAILERGGAL